MHDLLPPWPLLWAFILASTVLAVTPGPGVFYIVARSLLQGRRHGMASVAGVTLGALFVLIAAISDTTYALAAGSVAPTLQRVSGLRRAGRWLRGGAFIGLGVLTALSSARVSARQPWHGGTAMRPWIP